MSKQIDLHIHSNQSDGFFSPEKIVEIAAEQRLAAISITDHDNILAYQLAQQHAKNYPLEIIPGIEVSSEYQDYNFHFLGYFVDVTNPQLLDYLAFLKEERLKRAKKILVILERLGITIGLEEVLNKTSNGSIGRPHIADLMIEKGFVENRWEAFYKYIGDKGVAFVAKKQLDIRETIDLIHQANGICVVAHPSFERLGRFIKTWIEFGLDGIEVIHPRFSYYQTECLKILAKRYRVIKTGGSDCHGISEAEPRIGRFFVPFEYLEPMKLANEAVVSARQILQMKTG